jgi:ribosomal-protein-alanine N-acetyltransferase
MEAPSSLRPLTPDDLEAILAVENRVQVAPWTAEHFRGEWEKPYSRTWVLTDDETDSQVLGYIVFWVLLDECQILNVAVDLPYRGMGHAQRMVRAAIQDGLRSGATKAWLDVRENNVAAVQLYVKLGFTVTQIRRGFYSNGDNAYQMSLPLNEPKAERIDF